MTKSTHCDFRGVSSDSKNEKSKLIPVGLWEKKINLLTIDIINRENKGTLHEVTCLKILQNVQQICLFLLFSGQVMSNSLQAHEL